MKLFENGEMKRGTLMVSAILLAFLSACDTQTVQPSSASAVCDVRESSIDQPESSAPPAEEQPPLDRMDDGKLRVLYRSEDNLATVFYGSKIVFSGKSPVNSFELEDGREMFSVMTADEDMRSYSLYAADGTLLMGGLPASPNIVIGNWLFCTSDWYDEQEGCVINLDTMEQIPFSSNTAPFQIDENYFGLSYYDSGNGIRIYRISDLSEAEEFPDCWGYREMDLPGCISLHTYHSETEEYSSLLYSPASGQTYENFSRSCGDGLALLQDESGACSVLDVTTGEIIYPEDGEGDRAYQYYSDTVKIWRNFDQDYISAPCYPDAEQIDYANFSWLDGDSYFDVVRLDGSHDILDINGEKVAAITPAEGNAIYYIGYGYLFEHDADWQKSGVTLYGVDGSSVHLDRYNSFSWFQNTNSLLVGSYSVGSTYLMDLLDTKGNIVIEGLNDYYTYTPDPAGIIFVRKGFSYGIMDMEGNWLWKESIFQTTQDEFGLYY